MASPSSSPSLVAPPLPVGENSNSQGVSLNGFPQLFLLFLFLSLIYTIARYKGGCNENNEIIRRDIETRDQAEVHHRGQFGEQLRHSNILMQILRNSQHREEASRIQNENKSQLISQLLQSFQQRAPLSNYTSALPSECAICLDVFEEGNKQSWILPRCKHIFHEECIRKWLAAYGWTCPICRSVICFV
ncbi:hypothetical protein AQUCO_01000470v1 [Aquilegia coerulea]|uniref:RING-type E3 ubiquitin transferase n=1 Tax=Aquilegia coerulea TaxID=218851 RepID=A0A2G5EAJ9_AQUCA|nr:hypothetical protein AQUCO_01000470v1 [Aquilegia coerulea]